MANKSTDEHEHSPLNDLAAGKRPLLRFPLNVLGVTRTITRVMAAYPRVKLFRPKLKTTHFDRFSHEALPSVTAPPNRKSRLLPYAVNMVSGVALFSVYEFGKPKGSHRFLYHSIFPSLSLHAPSPFFHFPASPKLFPRRGGECEVGNVGRGGPWRHHAPSGGDVNAGPSHLVSPP